MVTKLEEFEDRYVATLEGDMDTAAAVKADAILKPLYKSNGKDVFIECKKLNYIASSGLRILVVILKSAKAAGSKVILCNVNEDVKNMLRLVGFVSVFEFEP